LLRVPVSTWPPDASACLFRECLIYRQPHSPATLADEQNLLASLSLELSLDIMLVLALNLVFLYFLVPLNVTPLYCCIIYNSLSESSIGTVRYHVVSYILWLQAKIILGQVSVELHLHFTHMPSWHAQGQLCVDAKL
jgi:hypothetical protein